MQVLRCRSFKVIGDCKFKHLRYLDHQENTQIEESDDERELTSFDVDLLTDAAKRYLEKQERRLSSADLNTLKSGYLSLINGKRDKFVSNKFANLCRVVIKCRGKMLMK